TAPFQIIGFDPAATLGSGVDPNISFNPNKIRNRYIDQNPKRADVLNWNVNVQRQFGTNWTLIAGYVGSRSVHLSVSGDDINSVAVPLLLSKSYRIGACDFDIRHILVGTVIWDVPGPKTGFASYVGGGWQIGTIVTATSGSPFTVTFGGGGDPLKTGFNGDF